MKPEKLCGDCAYMRELKAYKSDRVLYCYCRATKSVPKVFPHFKCSNNKFVKS